MHVSLNTPEIEEFVLSQVGQGRFANADEAVESLLAQLMRVVGALHDQASARAAQNSTNAPAPGEQASQKLEAAVSASAAAPASAVACTTAMPEFNSDLIHLALNEADSDVSFSASLRLADQHRHEAQLAIPARRDDDDILINGGAEELRAFAANEEKCVLLSPTCDEASLIAGIASRLGCGEIRHQWSSEYDKLTLAWKSRRAVLVLTLVPERDCHTIVRGFNALLAGEYEIRVFRHTLGEDARSLYVRPVQWWGEIEACFPQRIGQIFAAVNDEILLV